MQSRSACLFCAVASLVGLRGAPAENLSWPPKLPDGVSRVTHTSPAFLKPTATLKGGVTIARTPPAIDFLYYPGQTYPGNPWSNWGDALVVGERHYSAIGDHKGPDGNAFLYEYDTATRELRRIVDVTRLLNLPAGHYTPGKIHSRIDRGAGGWLYFATHRGSTRVTIDKYHYRGDWILRHHPATGKTEIVAHAPLPYQCIPTSHFDAERSIFYGGTAAGDYQDKRVMFFAYDVGARKVLYSAYEGPYRAIMLARSGRVYYTREDGTPLKRFDPGTGKPPVALPVRLGLRAATRETPQGYIYTAGRDGELWAFSTRTETAESLGSAAVGVQTYITTLDADPSGRYLYYVPGAHGGSERDGAPVVQYDIARRRKKIIAFLHPFFRDRYGYTPLGTFGTALSTEGDRLFITWNGNRSGPDRRGRLPFDTCALTVVHIPASERPVPSSADEENGITFEDASADWGITGLLKGIMAHAAAAGDIDGDGDLDLYVGTFCDRPPEHYTGVAGPQPNILLTNQLAKDTGSGQFAASGQNSVVMRARTSGAVLVDLDNDGDPDLYVSNNSKPKGLRVENRLFENRGGRFHDVSADNAACCVMGGRSVGVLDYDGDGLLDLLVAEDSWTGRRTRLFRNRGNLRFEDRSAAAGLPADLPGLGVITPDLNRDGWPDIFVSQANRLFLSRGDGTYREAGSEAFAYPPINREAWPCGVTCGDLDRDGDLDIVIVDHCQPARQHVFINQGLEAGIPQFTDVTRQVGLDYRFPSWTPERNHLKHAHVEIADMDNDAWPDILVAATYRENGVSRPFVCRNRGIVGGLPRFNRPPPEKGDAYYAVGPIGDYDRDGRLDIFFGSWLPEHSSRLFLNRSAQRHWIRVKVVGRTINRMGIGSTITVYPAGKLGDRQALLGYQEIGTGYGFCSGQEPVAHFGLGGAGRCDIEVTFPYGRGNVRLPATAADQTVIVREP